MKNLSLFIGLVTVLLSSCVSKNTSEVRDKTFLLNGESFVVKAVDIHYPRIPREYWGHRIKASNALGMNTICLYVFWNYHEQQNSQYDFKGQKDIAAFCRLAQKHNIYVIVCPVPYVCAEREMGRITRVAYEKERHQIA